MTNKSILIIIIFGATLSQSTFTNAETVTNPIKGGITSLELVANLLSGKISAKYNPLDQETFGKLSSDLISIGVQKTSPLITSFKKGDFALSVNVERDQLAHSDYWKTYTGVEEQSILVPAIGISYGISKETLANITYKQYKTDGARLIGGTLRNSFSISSFPLQTSIGISHSRLMNSAPLRLETTSIDLVGSYTPNSLKPYAGIGITHGKTEFQSVENMKFSGNFIKAFGGFEYFYKYLLISTEVGLSGTQSYQNLTFTYLF